MRTRILLTSLLALVGALGCIKGPDNSPPDSPPNPGPTSIQRAANPGMIPIDSSLEENVFNNLATVYLLAAANGSPFSTQYDRCNEFTLQGMPSDLQAAFEALVKYVRTGGDAAAAIKQHINVLKEHPLRTDLGTVPGTLRYESHEMEFRKFVWPFFTFIYEVDNQDGAGPQLSLQALFAVRNIDPSRGSTSADSVPCAIETLVAFKEPPQNIVLELGNWMSDKDVIVSPTLTLPAKCTAQGQDTVYKLTGVFRQPGKYHQKGGTFFGSEDKLEGLTYFRWGNEWYKITDSAPKPATTTAQEAQEAAEKSGYVSNAFRYLYTRDDAA